MAISNLYLGRLARSCEIEPAIPADQEDVMSIGSLKEEVVRQFGSPAVVVDLDIVERNIASRPGLSFAGFLLYPPETATAETQVFR
jgi:hypothetical protein